MGLLLPAGLLFPAGLRPSMGEPPDAGLLLPAGLRPSMGDPPDADLPCLPLLVACGDEDFDFESRLEERGERFLARCFDGPGMSSGELMSLWKKFTRLQILVTIYFQ